MPKFDPDTVPERTNPDVRRAFRFRILPGQSINDMAAADPTGPAGKLKQFAQAVLNFTPKAVADGDAEDNWVDFAAGFRANILDEDPLADD